MSWLWASCKRLLGLSGCHLWWRERLQHRSSAFKEHLQSVLDYDCSSMAVAMSTTMLMHSRPCLSQTSLGLFSRLQHSPQGSPRSMFQAEGASAVPF